MRLRSRSISRRTSAFIALVTVGLVASSCGGLKEGDLAGSSLKQKGLTAQAGEHGLATAGKPVRGGKLVYGMEADTNGGFCLVEGQLAISGMLVVRAVYDTLTVPNAKGEYVPYLAKTITHNGNYTEWKITLREGVKFHDGSPLTAQVVTNNLNAYRNKYDGRTSLLFMFVLENIKDVKTTGPLEVTVSTTKPWVAFPSYLYSSSRLGIMAQKQLDSKDHCDDQPIGTGPFKFKSWKKNVSFKTERNEHYWQMAPDGQPYPYAQSLELRPIPDGQVRMQAIEAGDINMMHTSNTKDMLGELYDKQQAGSLNMLVSEEQAEVAFLQLNNTVAPFNDPRMRKALAMGADRAQINLVTNLGGPTLANGPISPGSMGFVQDTGFPAYDKEAAKKLVEEYVKEGGKAEFSLTATPDQAVQELAQLVQSRAKEVGVKVKIFTLDQAALINAAIGKKYQAMTFRNYPGGDPDSLYVWFYGGTRDKSGKLTSPNLVNFAGIDDPLVDKALDDGRSEMDPVKRKKIYEDLDKRMGSNVYGVWTWFSPWAIVERSNVHGILGPPLPGPDASKRGPATTKDPARQPSLGLATGHSFLGLWVED